MAASKKTPKQASAPATAAFKHGASAYGARYVKQGFGFDEQEDLEWALGWPHVRRLVDGGKLTGFPVYDMDVPRDQAARWVRFHLFCPSTRDEANKWDVLAKPFTETPGPITEAEVRSVIALHLEPVGGGNFWWAFLPQIILLCEAFVGPEPVAEALVEAVEACAPEILTAEDSKRSDCVLLLGFLFLRLPETVRAALAWRLRKVLDTVVATLPGGLAVATDEPYDLPYRCIDRVLNGQQAVLRMGQMLTKEDLLFAEDPTFVVDWLRASPGPGDRRALARLAFLGGDGVLDLEAVWWKKYNEPRDAAKKYFIQDYGRIRSEKMLAILLAMSQSSKVRKQAAAWFAAHADYARPYLKRTAARSGDAAAWAKALLS